MGIAKPGNALCFLTRSRYNQQRPLLHMHIHALAETRPSEFPNWSWQRCFRNGEAITDGLAVKKYIDRFKDGDGKLSAIGLTIEAEICYYFSAIRWWREEKYKIAQQKHHTDSPPVSALTLVLTTACSV